MKYNYNGVWKDINIKVADTLPVGTIIPFGGTVIPANYRECNGSTLSRTEYALLFVAIGTSFGEGDGSTTFNLPDLRGKVPVGLDLEDTDFDTIGETGGEKEHTLTTNELPSHSHRQLYAQSTTSGSWGRDIAGVNYNVIASPANFYNGVYSGETGENQPHNIMQPYQIVKYIIKVLDAPASGIRSETLPVGTEVDFDGATTDIPTGWQQINGNEMIEYTLYENDSPTINANITLSDSLSNYSYFKVFGTFQDNFFTDCFGAEFLVSLTLGKRLEIVGGRATNYGVATYYACYNATDTQLTFNNFGQVLSSHNTGVTEKTDGSIKIYKVVGYKEV